jgi:hypothetical protein
VRRAAVLVGLAPAVLAVLVLSVPAPADAAAASAAPAPPTPVQDEYAQPGPFGVVHQGLADPTGTVPFELYRPRDLGEPGTRHAHVTWGNGSFAHPVDYDPLLRHLASWGFVVIASTGDQVGTGEEQLAGVQRASQLDADPGDPLHGHVDLERVAAAGHSQGAGGSVRAANAPSSPIDTVLTFDLPNQVFTIPPDTKAFDPSRLRVPVLFLSGADDQLISGTLTNRAFFRSVPGAAGMALLVGSDHNGIQHGARPYPGYATAWLRYQLDGDPVAAAAFTGPHPELLTAPGWQDQALKHLTAPAPAPAPEIANSGVLGRRNPAHHPPVRVVGNAGAAEGELPVTGGGPEVVGAAVLLCGALVLRWLGQIART